MNYPVIIIGAGGHARVLIDTLRLLSIELLGITDMVPRQSGDAILGVPVIGNDDIVSAYAASAIRLVNGIGSVSVGHHRSEMFERFKNCGYTFADVIHPSATIASDVVLSEGVQIMAGTVLQTGCRIGRNCIINSGAIIEHDCQIGDHVHVAPGAVLSGGVEIGQNAHIGTGATVIQLMRVGLNSLVGAGAVVIRDVPEGAKVAGNPAKELDHE